MKKINLSLVFAVFASLLMVLFVACKPEPEPEPVPTPDPVPDPEEPLPEGCFKDIDGNVYETIVIGKQTWMKQNLRTTHYADGTPIVDGSDIESLSDTVAMYCDADKRSHNRAKYGLLYNWLAATRGTVSYRNPSGMQGVCPDGWHLPSNMEWKKMINYVAAQSMYQCEDSGDNIAKALSSQEGWEQNSSSPKCSPSYAPETNNLTGFAAYPAGTDEIGIGLYAYFHTSGENQSYNSAVYTFVYNRNTVVLGSSMKKHGASVRCVKD